IGKNVSRQELQECAVSVTCSTPTPGARHWNDLNASALSFFLWLGHRSQRRPFAQRGFDYDARVFRENNLLSVRDPAGIERTCRTPITNSCGDIRRSACNGHNRAHEAQACGAADRILACSCVWAMGLAFINVERAAGHQGQDQRNGDFVPWFGRDLPFGVERELPCRISTGQPGFDALSLRARQGQLGEVEAQYAGSPEAPRMPGTRHRTGQDCALRDRQPVLGCVNRFCDGSLDGLPGLRCRRAERVSQAGFYDPRAGVAGFHWDRCGFIPEVAHARRRWWNWRNLRRDWRDFNRSCGLEGPRSSRVDVFRMVGQPRIDELQQPVTLTWCGKLCDVAS